MGQFFPFAVFFLLQFKCQFHLALSAKYQLRNFFEQQTLGITFSFCGKCVGVNSSCSHLKKVVIVLSDNAQWLGLFCSMSQLVKSSQRILNCASWDKVSVASFHIAFLHFVHSKCELFTPCFEGTLIVSSLSRKKNFKHRKKCEVKHVIA